MIGTILMTGASVTASLFVVQVAVLPLVFKYSKCVQRKMVFSNCINYPRNLDYENPASCNVIGGRNFSIQFTSKADQCPIKIGVWHIVPCCLFRDMFVIRDYTTIDPTLQIQLQRTRNPIVLYCHGNSNHRASPHRLQMYKVFQRLNFHVITFDYRGYGDSTPVRPTERGVVEDALCVYAWLIDSLDPENRPPVIIWGHSLGTAIASNLVANMARLCEEQGVPVLPQPAALVLEAPFNNLMEEIEKHPFSKLVSWLPYYKETFVKPFNDSSEYSFTTDQYLTAVPALPILILHAKGDKVVPYELSVKLHETLEKSRAQHPRAAPLVLQSFERGCGLGHNNLCAAPALDNIVRNFLTKIGVPPPQTNENTH
ncbi:lysophosphatidylserine lipase ABHD12-like isoform X2 [Plodia interpunctella]|uniref:lysophosphatidylserine lipase ABHD12-like isoform X2 n=1 Tax=Plodia interpunctella TaxID=58824 RepID=UPI002368F18A|nr:lysophosphatidylserine lipase ABHD12-like isoform X2 [Plodia interpunctella]